MTISNQMDRIMDSISELAYGKPMSNCIQNGICIMCSGEAKTFESEEQLREFKLTAMCRFCQDKHLKEKVNGGINENKG